jgi:hypothetical protein
MSPSDVDAVQRVLPSRPHRAPAQPAGRLAAAVARAIPEHPPRFGRTCLRKFGPDGRVWTIDSPRSMADSPNRPANKPARREPCYAFGMPASAASREFQCGRPVGNVAHHQHGNAFLRRSACHRDGRSPHSPNRGSGRHLAPTSWDRRLLMLFAIRNRLMVSVVLAAAFIAVRSDVTAACRSAARPRQSS